MPDEQMINIEVRPMDSYSSMIVFATDNFDAVARYFGVEREQIVFIGPAGDTWLIYGRLVWDDEECELMTLRPIVAVKLRDDGT